MIDVKHAKTGRMTDSEYGMNRDLMAKVKSK
jgi:hypothetical protein